MSDGQRETPDAIVIKVDGSGEGEKQIDELLARVEGEKPPPRKRQAPPMRKMTPVDRRRVTFATAGATDPRLVIIEQDPLVDDDGTPLPVVVDDEHRGLLHLDGKGEVRPPKDWEQENAEARYWNHAAVSNDLLEEARRERARLRLPELLALAMSEAAAIATPRAQQRRETDAKGAGDVDHAPVMDDGLAHAHRDEIDSRLLQVRLHIEAILDLVDMHRGHLRAEGYAMLDSDSKDALLTGQKFRGLTPEEIHALHPELGAPRTIRWVRSKAGQGHRGLPRDESKVRRKADA